jgi:hypothetical protein
MCETTSNSSLAMTPRIMMNNEVVGNYGEDRINGELDFTQSMHQNRLSPEQIERVREITNSRKKEIEATPQENRDAPNINECEKYIETNILDSDRTERRRQIIERLENLL